MTDPSASLPQREILTVGALTRSIKQALEHDFGTLWLMAEVSNLRTPASGHIYLTLKDSDAQLRGVIWGTTARYLKSRPRDGDQVLCRGRVTVYEPRGDYQLIIDYMEPAGVGALYQRIERTRALLQAEGLLETDRKRPLPGLPRRVGIVSSASGAALQDVLDVLNRRAPGLSVLLAPALVQGDDAARQVAAALEALAGQPDIDVIIVARGGGSLEDLMAFNDAALARAIATCPVPVVSGVGHETDVTMADLCADVRAATPSVAAELVCAHWGELQMQVRRQQNRLAVAMRHQLARRQLAFTRVRARLLDPGERLHHLMQRMDDLHQQLYLQMGRRLQTSRNRSQQAHTRLLAHTPVRRLSGFTALVQQLQQRLQQAGHGRVIMARHQFGEVSGRLQALSPLAVLSRGYAIVQQDDTVLRNTAGLTPGQSVQVRLGRGGFEARVESLLQEPEAEADPAT